jgi:hypothetical protein
MTPARIGLLILWGSSVLLATVHATAEAAAPPRTLSGVNEVEGSPTAAMAVRLPRAIQVDSLRDLVPVQGRGRLTAVLLKRDGGFNEPMLRSVRLGFCGKPGCTPAAFYDVSTIYTPRSGIGFKGVLPAGRYRLYIVTDGAPVRYRLLLPGLSGTSTLRPQESTVGSVVETRPTMSLPEAAPLLFSGGSSHHFGKQGGFNATLVWKTLLAPAVPSAAAVCIYDGVPAPGDPSPAFQFPNCPNGIPPWLTGTHDSGSLPTGNRSLSFNYEDRPLPQNHTFSLGGYHNTVDPALEAHSQQLWLDFKN